MGDPGNKLNRTLDAKLDRGQPTQIEPACFAVGSSVELREQADYVIQVGLDERFEGWIESTLAVEAEPDPGTPRDRS